MKAPNPGYAPAPPVQGSPPAQPPVQGSPGPVVTAYTGQSQSIFPHILGLYIRPGATILDATYGNGNFWKGPHALYYNLITLDLIKSANIKGDFCSLPLRFECLDALVLDPPYGNQGGDNTRIGYATYALQAGNSVVNILESYLLAMGQALVTLKPGGILILKCQDAIESGKQRRIEHVISDYAEEMGFEDLDTFVQVNPNPPIMRHSYQLHARKNHSYYRVFRRAGSI